MIPVPLLNPKFANYSPQNCTNFGFAALVEGEGGENQMIDPASSGGQRYWNFLHVKTQPPDAGSQAPTTKPPGPGSVGR